MVDSRTKWQIKRLKFIAPARKQILPSRPAGMRYIGLENIESGTGKLLLETEQEQVDSSVVTFDERSVLFGKLRPYLAKVATPDFKGVASTEIMVFEPINGNDRRFLSYSLLSDGFIKRVSAMVDGAKMPRANPGDVLNLRLGLPYSSEQNRIAAYLDEQTAKIDRLMELRRRQIDLLKEERAALIQQAVTRGLNPNAPMKDSGLPRLGEIPAHWEMKRIKHIARFVQTGGTPPSGNLDYYNDNGMDWYGPGDFSGEIRLNASARKISDLAIRDGYATAYEPPVILIVGIGASVGKIGLATQQCYTNQQVNSVGLCAEHSAAFFANFLSAYTNIIAANANHATLPIFNQTQTRNFFVVVPPPQEQTEIIEFIEQSEIRFDCILSAYTRQLTLLAEYRAALIHECVTGKRPVPEPSSPAKGTAHAL